MYLPVHYPLSLAQSTKLVADKVSCSYPMCGMSCILNSNRHLHRQCHHNLLSFPGGINAEQFSTLSKMLKQLQDISQALPLARRDQLELLQRDSLELKKQLDIVARAVLRDGKYAMPIQC
jgi:hypothetical protein